MTNEAALLGLLAELQRRIYALEQENARLRTEFDSEASGSSGV